MPSCQITNSPSTQGCGQQPGGPQKILLFQQRGSGESKLQGIRKYGNGSFSLTVIAIDDLLPPLIDDTEDYLPDVLAADLVLDFLQHPDLSEDLARKCVQQKIPIVASGKKLRVKGALAPPTCCGLSRHDCLGLYGEKFGAPELAVEVAGGRITRVTVLRGAPCGATWEAAERIVGWPVTEALARIGLETQFFCTANPAGWDPLYGKSPVHFAGELHKKALARALRLNGDCPDTDAE